MKYKNINIYYFTGTGNSKNISIWISQLSFNFDIKCNLVDISKIKERNDLKILPETLIVLISPIHGFNYPPVMLRFIKNFPKGKNNVLLLNTRAGMLIGRIITPGITGIAFYLSAFLLKIKGFSIVGMIPFDMPSNWMSIHPSLNERTIKYLHERNKEKVQYYIRKIILGKNCFLSFRDIIQDILISPVSILYFYIGRFGFAKSFYASGDCDNCGLCIYNCPVKAIINVDNRPYWTFKCESCMRCMSNCPKRAIETAHGLFVLIFFLSFNSYILNLILKFKTIYINVDNSFLVFVFKQFIFIIILTLSYRIIHYCLRYRYIERIILYTSLTKYKFWGKRYKAIKQNCNS